MARFINSHKVVGKKREKVQRAKTDYKKKTEDE
jgi:hypothetical protein